MKNVWQWILSIFIILTLISCGNSTDDGKIIQGTVYDDLIVGLNYQTKDYSSKTDENGKFNYKSGEVKFYLGSLYIGKIPTLTKDKKVFLSDMLNLKRGDYRTKELVKLATLLQSLDTTPINDEKIVLDENNIKELFTSNQTLENLDLNKLNLTLPKTKDVKQRVRDTLVQQNITPIDNINPTAKAGEDQTKEEGQSITLDGSSSTDTDGTITKYEWLENNQLLSTKKSFTKNDFSVGKHTITLKVTDNEEATHSDSIVITITAKEITPTPTPKPTPTNKPPVANAGDDQTVQVGSSVTLDGSKSTDTDGTITKYEWLDKNNNSLHVGKSYTTNSLTVGVHELTLKVTDNEGATNSDSVTITITALPPTNQFPTARAGDDQSVQVGQSVTLDASSSTDTDGTITKYEWFEGATSLGVGQTLTKSDFSVGVHTITLKVTDNKGATASGSVKVTITELPNKSPIANAGNDQTAQQGQSVTLDGSKSTDSDGTIVAYEWSENGTTLSTQKVFTKSDFSLGVHTITLKVTDNKGATNSDSVTITITELPNKSPIANAGNDQTAQQGTSVTLDGSNSTDEDISSLKYEWFENGTTLSTQKIFTKSDFTVGEHTITLKVTDNKGATASDTVKVTITDITPPTATITPANMATDVSLVSNITITFSEKVKGIDDKNITLTKEGSTIPLAYTLTNDNNTTLTLAHTSVFDFNTNYTLTIQNVTDNAGNTISYTTSTFTTLEKPSLYGKYFKTGQTTCYDYDTNQTEPCTEKHKGQDGYYQKGIERSYTKKMLSPTIGIVIDNVTGLMWQDSLIPQKTWNDAKTYCDTLTFGGYSDWRLPNINELKTIVDFGRIRNKPTGSLGAIDPIFKKVLIFYYWSSTTSLHDISYAWYVNFYMGDANKYEEKSSVHHVRCVR